MKCIGCRAQAVHDVGGATVVVDYVGGTSDVVYLLGFKKKCTKIRIRMIHFPV